MDDGDSFIPDPFPPGDPDLEDGNPGNQRDGREGGGRRSNGNGRRDRGGTRSERGGRRGGTRNEQPGHITFESDDEFDVPDYPREPGRPRNEGPRMHHPEYEPGPIPPMYEGYRSRQPEFWPEEMPYRNSPYRHSPRQQRYRFAHDHFPMQERSHFTWQPYPWRIEEEGLPRYEAGDGRRGNGGFSGWPPPPWIFYPEYPGRENRREQYSDNPGHGNPGHHGKEKKIMEGLASDKVNINVGGEGGGGAGLAALIAAMNGGGGRSDGSANAALMALLMGGRDRDHCYNGDGFGLGGGGIGALLLFALLGGGLGGGFGRGHGDHVNVDCGRRGGREFDGDPFVLSKLGSIEGAIPLAASQIQNGILESTAGITNTINQTGLAQLAATSGVKDAVQNSATAILQNASANTQSILTAICTLSGKIDQNTILDLQRRLGVAEADACEERNSRRTREVEVNVTQQVNQQQAQQQQQRIEDDRFNRLFANLSAFIGNQVMVARQGQDVINFGGTMTASGTQAAANTQVR